MLSIDYDYARARYHTHHIAFHVCSVSDSHAHARSLDLLLPLYTHMYAHTPSCELEKLLQLDTLEGRTWKIQEAIATENVGLKEGLEWVGSTLPKAGCSIL